MDRKEELLALCGDNKTEVFRLVEEIVFLENQLDDIKSLPFIKTNPSNKMQQKALPAGKLYKELLQQYNSCIKLFAGLSGSDMEDEESPLRKWIKGRMGEK